MMRRLRSTMSRRKPLAKLLILGVIAVTCVAYFVVVSLLNMESGEKLGRHDRHLQTQDWSKGRAPLKFLSAKNRSARLASGNPLDVPRVAEYCNIPTDVKIGEEGEAPQDYTLGSVYVVIRHGDRTPISTFFGLPRPSPQQGCTMDTDILQSIPELRSFLSDMESQKDKQPARSDFSKWALYPQHRECGSSQLTGNGALQHLFNGLALKEKYLKRWNLFGTHFSPSTQLDLRSTQISRTYQSALSLLYAFLPRFNVSELDIQVARNSMFCSPSLVPTSCCSNLSRLKQEIEKTRTKLVRKNPFRTAAMEAVGEVFGVKNSQLPGATGLVDVLQGHACHSVPLPCNDNGKCVTAAMMENLWMLVDSDGKSYTKDPKYDRYCRTLSHSLLLEILSNMVKVSRNKSPVKFTLYSGHDLTVSPLLQTLGVHNGKWPHYATRIVFELYRKLRSRGDHYLRVLHNGKDITSHVRFCQGRTVEGMCSLKHFQYFVERDNLKAIGVLDRQTLESFCKSKT